MNKVISIYSTISLRFKTIGIIPDFFWTNSYLKLVLVAPYYYLYYICRKIHFIGPQANLTIIFVKRKDTRITIINR